MTQENEVIPVIVEHFGSMARAGGTTTTGGSRTTSGGRRTTVGTTTGADA